jgi:GNAT superfamily N-acetyltransferase
VAAIQQSNPSPQGQARPGGFRVRPARRGDAEALASLLGELGYPGAADTATVHWVLSHPEMAVIVAADPQDKPVGVITLSHRPQLRMKGRIVTIDEVVVSAAWRRKGVGRALMKAALERAKVLTAKRVELHTHKSRGEAVRAFYESCGFQEVDSLVMRLTEGDFQPR